MDYTTIAASIEQARADIKVQIDDLRERDVALEQSLTWAAIAYGIDTDANGEPITVEGEGSGRCVNCDHDDHYGERCDGVCDDGPACACSWPDAGNFTVVPTTATATAKPTRQQAMAEAAKEQVTCEGCGRSMSKFGIGRHRAKCTPVAAEKLPKHAFDQQAARDAVAGPPTGPVKPVSIMPLAATPEPKPRDAGYVSVGQVVAAAGDL